MELPITTILASSIAIWFLILSWGVVKQRRIANTSLGDGGNEPLLRKIRAQANLAEYAPLFIVMIGLAEHQGGNSLVVGVIAAAFMLARIMHGFALAFTAKSPAGRYIGVVLTFISFGAIALHNILLFIV